VTRRLFLGSSKHSSDILFETDENGGLEWKREYEPYGKPQYNGDKSVVGYTEHEYTVESGLSYMKARWYEPELGRFLLPDPVQHQPGNPTSFNRYAYANNSPYMFVDPDGRADEFADLRYTLAVIVVDAATADPSDVAAPVKGAGYLGAVIGTAIGGSLYWAGNKIINGPDTQGTPPGGGDDPNNENLNIRAEKALLVLRNMDSNGKKAPPERQRQIHPRASLVVQKISTLL